MKGLSERYGHVEPEGGVWDREVIGKNWFRYQTVGASALQSTRAMLMTYPSTTQDRVRLLKTLHEQLQNSVEQASTELLQLIGSRDGGGPYACTSTGRGLIDVCQSTPVDGILARL